MGLAFMAPFGWARPWHCDARHVVMKDWTAVATCGWSFSMCCLVDVSHSAQNCCTRCRSRSLSDLRKAVLPASCCNCNIRVISSSTDTHLCIADGHSSMNRTSSSVLMAVPCGSRRPTRDVGHTYHAQHFVLCTYIGLVEAEMSFCAAERVSCVRHASTSLCAGSDTCEIVQTLPSSPHSNRSVGGCHIHAGVGGVGTSMSSCCVDTSQAVCPSFALTI